MTKQFEEMRRGTVAELRAYYEENPPRGEVVIVLGGAPERVVDEAEIRERVRALRGQGMSAKDTAAAVAKELGVSRRVAYQLTGAGGVKRWDRWARWVGGSRGAARASRRSLVAAMVALAALVPVPPTHRPTAHPR